MVLFRELGLEPGRNDNDSLMIARTHVATRFDSSLLQGGNDFVRPRVSTKYEIALAMEQSGFHADRVTFRFDRNIETTVYSKRRGSRQVSTRTP